MANRQQTYIALLRGINVGGKNKIPMAELRSICTAIDCDDVQTYIQSGNVVLTASSSAKALEENLENAIADELGLTIPVLVRSASQWKRYIDGNPCLKEAKKEPNWVLLCLSKSPPDSNAVSQLQQRATLGERVVRKGDAIWIHFAGGIGRSRLTPAVLDRHVGSPVTARNWRTVVKLDEMARET